MLDIPLFFPTATLDRAKLTKKVGALPSDSRREVQEWLKDAIYLD